MGPLRRFGMCGVMVDVRLGSPTFMQRHRICLSRILLVRALESRSKDDDTKWLTYWVVFALFSVIEFFSDILVGWVPFYWLTKCAFLIWCMSPLDGSSTIYFKIVLPLFKRNQSKVDSFIDRAKEKAGGFTDQMISEAGRIASEAEKKTD